MLHTRLSAEQQYLLFSTNITSGGIYECYDTIYDMLKMFCKSYSRKMPEQLSHLFALLAVKSTFKTFLLGIIIIIIEKKVLCKCNPFKNGYMLNCYNTVFINLVTLQEVELSMQFGFLDFTSYSTVHTYSIIQYISTCVLCQSGDYYRIIYNQCQAFSPLISPNFPHKPVNKLL